MQPVSRLQALLENAATAPSATQQRAGGGRFVVTTELTPPKGADPEAVRTAARLLRTCADAVNVTDCQTAVTTMSSLAAAVILMQEGVEPIMQMVARDRNSIALQSEVLGASALGVRNILCLTGDPTTVGNHPQAKPVFELKSEQLVAMLKAMRDQGAFLSGDRISTPPQLFLGAVANPGRNSNELKRLQDKVGSGAQFIQTQAIFDTDVFEAWMQQVRELGLHNKTHILAGVIPLKSSRMMARVAEVPGIVMPQQILERMRGSSDDKEGINIAVEIIERLRGIEGVSGVHIMAIAWAEAAHTIAERAGLLPRPH
jgi:methylenetetrahydrofolate reductase (NADPH)